MDVFFRKRCNFRSVLQKSFTSLLELYRLEVIDKLEVTPPMSLERSTMAMMLTERAAEEVKRVCDQQKFEDTMFLRVGVAGGGCSGFSYTLGFDKEFDDQADSKYDFHGVNVVVDKKSALYLDGTTIDWFDGLEKRGFTFDNPNAVKTCGCGSSFQA